MKAGQNKGVSDEWHCQNPVGARRGLLADQKTKRGQVSFKEDEKGSRRRKGVRVCRDKPVWDRE